MGKPTARAMLAHAIRQHLQSIMHMAELNDVPLEDRWRQVKRDVSKIDKLLTSEHDVSCPLLMDNCPLMEQKEQKNGEKEKKTK